MIKCKSLITRVQASQLLTNQQLGYVMSVIHARASFVMQRSTGLIAEPMEDARLASLEFVQMTLPSALNVTNARQASNLCTARIFGHHY